MAKLHKHVSKRRHLSFFYEKKWNLFLITSAVFPLIFFMAIIEFACPVRASGANIDEEYVVTGTGSITRENIADARDKAISRAFSAAVEKYLVQRLRPRVLSENFQRLDEEIISGAKDEIRDYRIITEYKTDEYIRMLLSARVNKEVLERNLKNMGIIEGEAVHIVALVMVSEMKPGLPETCWWNEEHKQRSLTITEISLSRVLEEKGIRALNRPIFIPREKFEKDMRDLNLTDEEAVKWGNSLSADIVITGEAYIHSALKASAFLKVIRVSDGKDIAGGFREESIKKPSDNESTAIELAVNKWAEEAVPSIMESFKPSKEKIGHIIITVKGLRSFREFLDFKRFLSEDFQEVKSVIERSLKGNTVKFSTELEGDSKKLVEKLRHHDRKPFPFDIIDVEEKGFTLVVI